MHIASFNLGELVMQQIKDHTKKIALGLRTVGLINTVCYQR
jgi:carbamoyl-phosphate synthase large subunit